MQSSATFLDDHDNAIVGIVEINSSDEVEIAYSVQQILSNLVDMGMDREEASDVYDFQIAPIAQVHGITVIEDRDFPSEIDQ